MKSSKMYSKLLLSAALCTGSVLLAQSAPGGGGGGGGAQQTPPSMPSQQTEQGVNSAGSDTAMQQNMADRSFVKKALEGGMAEVQLGQLAQQKSQSDDVKQFGQKMVQDHTQMGDQLIKPIAQQLSVKEPKELPKKDRELVAKLQNLSGPQFDDAYIKAMMKDHKDDLNDFKDEAQTTQNPNLKQAAQQGTNVISQHLQMIQQIAQSHNVTASK